MHSESPSKRRKKNDSKSVPVPNRSLDFFFRKQNNQQDATEASSKPAVIHNTNGDSPVPETQLTDEELARKLQEEWAKEDGQNGHTSPQNGEGSDREHKAEEDVKDFV